MNHRLSPGAHVVAFVLALSVCVGTARAQSAEQDLKTLRDLLKQDGFPAPRPLDRAELPYLRGVARDTWACIAAMADEKTGLPYDSSDRGFYNWHTDFAPIRPLRKLSISIQLSRSEDYEGGDLELMYGIEPQKLDRTRGAFIVFPSFMLHRVTPVTRGTRWSLVAWILGARWR